MMTTTRPHQRQPPPIKCEACSTENWAISRCMTCDHFLCHMCQRAHERWAVLKSHTIRTLAQLRSGGGADASGPLQQQDGAKKCPKHSEKNICWYCVTCEQLVCATCCNVYHKSSEHSFIGLPDAEVMCKLRTVELVSELKEKTAALDRVVQARDRCLKKMEAKFEDIKRRISLRANEEVSRVGGETARIRKEELKLKQELENIYEDKMKTLETAKAELRLEVDEAWDTLDEVDRLSDKANFYELFNLKRKILHNLKERAATQQEKAPDGSSFLRFDESARCGSIGRLVPEDESKLQPNCKAESPGPPRRRYDPKEFWDFQAFQKMKLVHKQIRPGNVSSPVSKERGTRNVSLAVKVESKLELRMRESPRLAKCCPKSKWRLQIELKTFGPEQRKLAFANYVAVFSDSEIVVKDLGQQQLLSLSLDSNLYVPAVPRRLLISGLIKPRNVAVDKDDHLVVLDNMTVKIFDRQYRLLRTFVSTTGKDSTQTCLAVDDSNRIAVGYKYRREIGLHDPNGSLIRKVPAPMVGDYLTAYKQQLIYTSYERRKLLAVNYDGSMKFTVDVTSDLQGQWGPTGVCCDGVGRIYVAVAQPGTAGDIHHYSPDAQYLGCVIKQCGLPRGIALTPGGDLVVAAKHSVQIYHCA